MLCNAFEKFCFPPCINDMSQIYFSSLNFRKPCKYIYILQSEVGLYASGRALLHAKQTEHNNSESNMHFMIAITVKGLKMVSELSLA